MKDYMNSSLFDPYRLFGIEKKVYVEPPDPYENLESHLNVFFPHVPGWMEDCRPPEAVITHKEDLYELEPVKFFLSKGAILQQSENNLMAIMDNGTKWYVMGRFYRKVNWFPIWREDACN